jgi:serine/threonine protein kinase/Tfp pilus assembly protein PilF
MTSLCLNCSAALAPHTPRCPRCGTSAPKSGTQSTTPPDPRPHPHAAAATLPPGITLPPTGAVTPPAAATDSGPLSPGQQFGPRYHIKRLLGLGGMGAVYQAWDTELGVDVAIKLIRPEIMAAPEASADLELRFKRELLLARLVSHRNVVRIHDLGTIDGIKYITMSYVDGVELGTILATEGRLPVQRVLKIARRIVGGLVAAHAAGVVHRDLKPANVMVGPGDEAFLMDFGIARLTDDSTPETDTRIDGVLSGSLLGARYGSVTRYGSMVGTVEYMAPEQARGERVDQRADVYALGLLLYDMLAGPVRRTQDASPLAELESRSKTPPPRLTTIVPGIPEPLAALVSRCIDPAPDKRPQSSAEVAAALEALDANGQRIPIRRTVGLPRVIGASIVALSAIAAAWWHFRASDVDPEVTAHSIAVLPFTDLSAHKDQDYLSDGMSEELLNLLSKIPELRVAARTSAFAFKNKAQDVTAIAKKLHVAHILEGSVRTSGNRVRISAQLIRADSGYQLWSETYDRDVDDLFKLQDEIAGSVAQTLKVALLGGSLPARPTPSSLAAYNLYLQGRFFADSHTKEGAQKAIELFQTAITMDPGYEPTWTALSFAYSDAAGRGVITADEGLAKARSTAAQGLKLDPKSSRARVALGLIHMNYDWDWVGADREFKQALATDPGNATVLGASAYLDLALGRTEQALGLFKQAVARDPLHASSFSNLGATYFAMGRYKDAEAAFRKSIELKPTASYTHNGLGMALLLRDQRDAALAEMKLEPDDSWRLQGLAIVNHALGQASASDAALTELTSRFSKDAPYAIATVHAYRGETAAALDWLDRAYAEKDSLLAAIKIDPLLRSLVGDPRYKALLGKLALPN